MVDIDLLPQEVQDLMNDPNGVQSNEALEEAAWCEIRPVLSGKITNLSKKEQLETWREVYLKVLDRNIMLYNAEQENNDLRKKAVHSIPGYISGRIIMEVYTTIRLNLSSNLTTTSVSVFVPAIYDEDTGLYDFSDTAFNYPMSTLSPKATATDEKKMRQVIIDGSPRRNRTGLVGDEKDLIPFKNGILNYRTKDLIPYSPDYVFIWQLGCDWNPNAKDVGYTTANGKYYTFESWLSEITAEPRVVESDDDSPSVTQYVPCPENVLLMKQMIGSVARPFVDWQQSVWLYSQSGSSGKGTILSLLRCLLGNRCTDLSLGDMTEQKSDFIYQNAIEDAVVAILGDENPVDKYIDDISVVKAIISHDPIRINRKGKEMIYASLFVVMIQCLNALPKMKDMSQSNLRRQVIVEFYRHYSSDDKDKGTDQEKDTGIKNVWFMDPELQSYVMKACLMDIPDYYHYTETENVRRTRASMMEQNSPVKRFVLEVLDSAPDEYDRLPFPLLYTLYKAWYKVNIPDKQCLSENGFRRELEQALRTDEYWQFENRRTFNVTSTFVNKMTRVSWDAIDRYDCRDLMEMDSTGHVHPGNRDRIGILRWKLTGYKGGIWRTQNSGISGVYDMDEPEEEPVSPVEKTPVQTEPIREPNKTGNPNPYTPPTLAEAIAE